MSSLVVVRMTKAEASQLLSYIDHRDQGSDGGWYYAPKDQFEARHKSLKDCIERALIKARDADRDSAL